MRRKISPAILLRYFCETCFAISLPIKSALMVRKARALITPAKTKIGEYCVASNAEASCVLSPSSAKKMRRKEAIKGFPLSSATSSGGSVRNKSSPKTRNNAPLIPVKIRAETYAAIVPPKRIATPSMIRKPRNAPRNKYVLCVYRVESVITASCVLSPSSAKNIAINGMKKSVSIAIQKANLLIRVTLCHINY